MKFDKEKLKKVCLDVLTKKVEVLRRSIQETQNSSNSETKSTAGDKHETSRAMAQLEVERLSQQLEQQERLLTLLKSVSTSSMTSVQSGALVKTNKGVFYLSVALGAINSNGNMIMTIGMSATISQLMLNKTEGEEFSFNGNKYHIEEII